MPIRRLNGLGTVVREEHQSQRPSNRHGSLASPFASYQAGPSLQMVSKRDSTDGYTETHAQAHGPPAWRVRVLREEHCE